jgi:hypothetical protein
MSREFRHPPIDHSKVSPSPYFGRRKPFLGRDWQKLLSHLMHLRGVGRDHSWPRLPLISSVGEGLEAIRQGPPLYGPIVVKNATIAQFLSLRRTRDYPLMKAQSCNDELDHAPWA